MSGWCNSPPYDADANANATEIRKLRMQLTKRRNATMALALSLQRIIPLFSTAAFNHCTCRNRSTNSVRTFHHRLKSSTSASRDDPSLTSQASCYNHLKQSRPIRIQAKALHPRDAVNAKAALANNNNSSITKLVHFQRHGQGTHNQLYKEWTDRTGIPIDLSETDPKLNPLLLPDIIDAPLTQKGRDQCRAQLTEKGEYLGGVELIVVSPLVRALETACITFEEHLPTSTNTNDERRGVKWIAHEGLREELGLLLCNQRRGLKETLVEFPHVDFSLLEHHDDDENDEDVYWRKYCEQILINNADGTPKRESIEDMSHRAYAFLVEYLYHRPEKEIAVVGHSAWLLAMTNAVLDFAEESGELEQFGKMFGQAELRSATLTFTEK